MTKLTPAFLEGLAYFYANTDRAELVDAGLIAPGKSGDDGWKRFNHNFDIFILKLSSEKQEKLSDLMQRFLPKEKAAPDTETQAASLAQMVTEYVEGGIHGGGDWRRGLKDIIFYRLQRFSAFSDVNPEARYIADSENACPHCGGSGHIDDLQTTGVIEACADIARDIHNAEIKKRDEALAEGNNEGALTRARQAQTAELIEERIRALVNIDPNAPVTGDQLRSILGIEPEDGLDEDRKGEIQTCSGSWMKIAGTGLWSFNEDEKDAG